MNATFVAFRAVKRVRPHLDLTSTDGLAAVLEHLHSTAEYSEAVTDSHIQTIKDTLQHASTFHDNDELIVAQAKTGCDLPVVPQSTPAVVSASWDFL